MAWNNLAIGTDRELILLSWYGVSPDSLRSKRLPLTYYTKIGARESMEATIKTQKNLWTKN